MFIIEIWVQYDIWSCSKLSNCAKQGKLSRLVRNNVLHMYLSS